MLRRLGCSALLAASLATIAVSAQHHPDFSGQWTLVSEKSSPPNTWAMGQEFSITQDATTLAIMRPMGKVAIVYNLNGPETRHVAQPASPSPPQARSSVWTWGIEESSWTATWAGDYLALVTNNTVMLTQPDRQPSISRVRQTVRDVLSLDPDGTLVVEHLITVDPPTSTPGVAPPVPIRGVYRKTPR